MERLTQKQHDFVVNYIKNGFNAYKAAIAAGYSEKFAKVKTQKLITHPVINRRIAAAYQAVEMSEVSSLCMSVRDKALVLDRIIRAIVPLDEAEPVKLEYARDAIRAVAELNKMSGHYQATKHLSLNLDVTKDRILEARKIYEEY